MNRRHFLKYSLVTGAAFALRSRFFTKAQGTSSQLEPQEISWQLHPELKATSIWSFANGQSPVLRFKQGETATINVKNSLPEATSVHWHGLRVPNAMDGVPYLTQDPIMPDETYQYEFELEDAGTYWYHTHSNSQEQLGRGLAGAFIVEEQNPPDVDEDFVLLLQDWRLENNGQIRNDFYNGHDLAHEGRLGNAVSVNSNIQPNFTVKPNSRVRLRFINASTARLYMPNLSDLSAWIIAQDGQAVAVEAYQPQMLGPGMRLDIIADIPEGKTSLTDQAYDPYPLFSIEGVGDARTLRMQAPEALEPNPIALATNPEKISLKLEGGAMSGMMNMMGGGVWKLNGKSLAEDLRSAKPMFLLEQGKPYELQIVNKTQFVHPMHMHGYTFQLLSQSKQGLMSPRLSDTALLLPQETTSLSFVADNPGDWLIHCHVLGHQAAGMMAVMKVV